MDAVHYSDISDASAEEDTSREDADDSDTESYDVDDDVDKHEDPAESVNSTVSGNSKAAANEQTFPTCLSAMNHPNNITPCFKDMVTSDTHMLSPKQSLVHPPTERNLEQMITLKEMQEFVETFRKSRALSGITQKEVGLYLSKKCGIKISNHWISRFEGFNEFFKTMCELKPVLECFLEDFHRESVTSR